MAGKNNDKKTLPNRRGRSIGVFDSGFGGLNILRGIVKKLPEYDYVYLGDTARNPYGNRSPEVVYTFTEQAVEFLIHRGCGLIVIACNTASSDALRKIQREYLPKYHPEVRVLGVLIPGAEKAVETTKNSRIGVIATENTVASKAFVREITKLNPQAKIFQNACPLLTPLIESGEKNAALIHFILENYLRPLLKKNIDTLILGCTHYGILEKQIRKIVGPQVNVISEAQVDAEKLMQYLDKHDSFEQSLKKKKLREFYSTDLTKKFKVLGSKFFGQGIDPRLAILK